jgi:hypothetical protein
MNEAYLEDPVPVALRACEANSLVAKPSKFPECQSIARIVRMLAAFVGQGAAEYPCYFKAVGADFGDALELAVASAGAGTGVVVVAAGLVLTLVIARVVLLSRSSFTPLPLLGRRRPSCCRVRQCLRRVC